MSWTKTEEKQLINLHSQGLTLGQISEALGKTEEAV